jgi:hypothetical protein
MHNTLAGTGMRQRLTPAGARFPCPALHLPSLHASWRSDVLQAHTGVWSPAVTLPENMLLMYHLLNIRSVSTSCRLNA